MVRARNFRYMKLHIHPHNRYDADGLKELLEKKILVEMVSVSFNWGTCWMHYVCLKKLQGECNVHKGFTITTC